MCNHLIIDNMLVAFETMHHISQNMNGKEGEVALKLNMSKVYDRVEWGCVEKIMQKMVFDEKWENIMMRCVSTVTYFVKINGRSRGCITPTRGLCQGDPFSLYLLLLCAKGLSALLKQSVEQGLLKGVTACQGAP